MLAPWPIFICCHKFCSIVNNCCSQLFISSLPSKTSPGSGKFAGRIVTGLTVRAYGDPACPRCGLILLCIEVSNGRLIDGDPAHIVRAVGSPVAPLLVEDPVLWCIYVCLCNSLCRIRDVELAPTHRCKCSSAWLGNSYQLSSGYDGLDSIPR